MIQNLLRMELKLDVGVMRPPGLAKLLAAEVGISAKNPLNSIG